jgi:hypothetical protein
MTLLRGIDGPLFPSAGLFHIELELRWDTDGRTRRVTGGTSVTIAEADPDDPDQRLAAEVVLNGSSMMPVLVQGLSNEEGLEALGLALKSKTLAPHYRATALKCYLKKRNRKVALEPLFANLLQTLASARPGLAGTRRNVSSVPPSSRDRFTSRDYSPETREIIMTKKEKEKLQPLLDELGELEQLAKT